MPELHLKIVTPDKLFFDQKVDSIIAKGVEGDLAILKSRTPIATPLTVGKIRIFQDGKENIALIREGYMISINNNINIVTDDAKWLNEIDTIETENINI